MNLKMNFETRFSTSIKALKKIYLTGKESQYSIKTKLIAAFLALVLPMLLLGIVSYSTSASSIKKLAASSTEDTMVQASNYLELLFSNIDSFSMQIYLDQTIQDYLSNKNGLYKDNDYDMVILKQDSDKALSRYTFSNKFITSVLTVGENNKILTSGSYSTYGYSISSFKDTKFYEKISNADSRLIWMGDHSEVDEITRPEIYKNEQSKINNKFSLTAARMMKSLNTSKSLGFLLIDLNLDIIDNLFDNMSFSNGSEIHFISPDGCDYSTIKSEENNSKDSSKSEEINEVPTPKINLLDEDFYKKIVNSEETMGSSTLTINRNKYLMVFQKIGASGFILFSFIPESGLLLSANKIASTTIILVIISILAALALGLTTAVSFGNVINKINKVANLASTGNLTLDVKSNRKDEFGFLSSNITSMITNMRALIKQVLLLTQRVSSSASIVATTTQEVSSVSNEISIAMQEIAQGASSQASDAEQGTIKMSELAQDINNVSENTKAIGQFSTKTLDFTREGLSSIEELSAKSSETISIVIFFQIYKFLVKIPNQLAKLLRL